MQGNIKLAGGLLAEVMWSGLGLLVAMGTARAG